MPAVLTIVVLLGLHAVACSVEGQDVDASRFKGVNWADRRDNFVDGPIVPSGIRRSDPIEKSASDAERILGQLQQLTGANTVRMGINPPTVLDDTWWRRYRALIAAARGQDLRVILACWESASARDGKIDDRQAFDEMWDRVVADYADDPGVCFEVFNEPFGYSDDAWCDLAAAWLERHEPSLGEGGRSRVLIGGTGYCERLGAVSADPRLTGCLLSFHLYDWFGEHRTVDRWRNDLRQRIGEANRGRTVVTEWGASMAPHPQDEYQGDPGSGSKRRTYLAAMSSLIREWRLGSVYWPGLRDGDPFSLTTRERGSLKLIVTNRSGIERLRWSFGAGAVAE